MIIGKVMGTVVATSKSDRLEGVKFQIVQPVDIITLKVTGQPIVAIDTVGAGVGELVMLVSGSSARQTERTTNTPTDSSIIAIIDTLDVEGKEIFKKGR